MPGLSYVQRRVGRQLGSATAVADSKQTLLCTYLSAVLLVGLGLNSLFGWSWADPLAALVIAAVAVREGIQAWRGDMCRTERRPKPTWQELDTSNYEIRGGRRAVLAESHDLGSRPAQVVLL